MFRSLQKPTFVQSFDSTSTAVFFTSKSVSLVIDTIYFLIASLIEPF